MKVSKFALAAVLALGVTATVSATAASAQQPAAAAQPAAPQRTYNLSAAERTAIIPLVQAAEQQNWAAVQAALPVAQAAAQGADARYVIAQVQLRLAISTNNKQAQAQAIDAMLASGAAQPAELPTLLNNQVALALETNDLRKAEQGLARIAEMNPNDPQATVNLAELKVRQNQQPQAVQLFQRAIQLREGAGQRPPESWYKRVLAIAYAARMPQTVALSRSLVAAYPTPANWRDTLLIYRDLNQLDESTNLDLLRLMRVVGSLSGERDFFDLAQAANSAGNPGEASAVLTEGVSRRMIDGNKAAFSELIASSRRRAAEDRSTLAAGRTRAMAGAAATPAIRMADAYYGYGQFPEAAALYRAALGKTGVDANLVNTRLGASLAQAGQRAEAEAAFRAVTGPRAGLAELWLAWLARRPA